MKKAEEREKDLLGRFMNPEGIEKTSEGFNEKVMSAVRVASLSTVRRKERATDKIVPVAVIVVLLALVIISLITGQDDKSLAGTEFSKIFQQLAHLQIKAPSLPGLDLPGLAVYISVGIFVLWIFDLLLGKVFYRRQ
jgi:hypothetical protein